ncbi:MAG: zinc ribbon domain-containing protein [Sandaracinus sp.]|nr:zinc ribbon domain-containing protein [Myxococcales bacterium]MCB9600640.1 zinc ribbon domain-containing protein [Sandaracinus sp.]MCB9617589.1 zinc ribbon domain-containing protein [Sandaracinus sp.]
MASNEIVCTVCGAKNEPNAARCTSCGARIDPLDSREYSAEEAHQRRYQQDSFSWMWCGVSIAIFLVLQAVALGLLPMVISSYDPQGLPGLLISAGVWFVGGLVVARLSPGKTFLEPAVAAGVAVVPTLLYLNWIADVYKLSLLANIVGGLIGVMVTLLGSFIGEKLQMGRG